jgi:hypothetical protein
VDAFGSFTILGKIACVALLYFFLKRELGGTFDLRDASVATEGGSAPLDADKTFAAVDAAEAGSSSGGGGYQSGGGGYQSQL